MKTTPFKYYDEVANHGNYQYLSLKKIIDGFYLETQDDDSILKNTPRYKILNHTKDAIRELNKKLFDDVRAMEITVPEKLYMVLPHNFVDYVRVSRVVVDPASESYRLQPLDINENMNIADGYLQDHDGEILFDDDGGILMADSANVYNKPYKKYIFDSGTMGGNMEKDTSKLSKHGEFVIDKRNGKIAFSSDLYDQEIVLEYLTDGLEFDTYDEGSIKVHKNTVKTLKDWVYFACIQYKASVPKNEKNRALQRYKTTLHESKIVNAKFDLLQINRALRSSSKNL